MILTAAELYNFGFPLSSEDDSAVQRSIKDAELFFVKNIIGESVYLRLHNAEQGTDDYKAVNGTTSMAGLKMAIAHLTMSELFKNFAYSTRFGVVRKTADESSLASVEQMQDLANRHRTIGNQYIREVCKFLNIKADWKIVGYEY